MMTIMMQFFTSAQKMWNASAKRNMIYADARVAMNLMTREIQCMLYDNDEIGDIYPFWFEWTEITTADSIKEDYKDNNEFPLKSDGTTPYLTALNFIATTDLKPIDKGSDICEIKYKFTPISFSVASPKSTADVTGGKLERSCTSEYDSEGNPTASNIYNFQAVTYEGNNLPAGRVNTIWEDISSAGYDTVIDGVYSLKFSCYKWDSGLKLHEPMNNSGKDKDNNDSYSTYGYGTGTGTPCPVAVRIDMKLMDPKDLKLLALNIYRAENGDKEAAKQVKTLKQKIRTFSKVIYLGQQ
jgi:hypothetical protein